MNNKELIMAPTLYLTCGISGSGKSKYADFIKDAIQAVEVNADNIRKEFGDISDQTKNEEVFRELDKRINQHLAGGMNVIISNTNLHHYTIADYAKRYPYNRVIAMLMEDSKDAELCKSRVRSDISKGIIRSNVPDEVIDKQAKNFQLLLEDIEKKEWPKNVLFYVVKQDFSVAPYSKER